MIHYINGKPHKNVQMNKPKRRAVENYRHGQRRAEARDIAIRICIVLAVGLTLTAVYLIRTA